MAKKPSMTDEEARAFGKPIKEAIKKMTDEERVDFFRFVTVGYCVDCGRKLQSGVCHCENDE